MLLLSLMHTHSNISYLFLFVTFVQDNINCLHLAAEKGWADIVNFLIMHGANVDAKDKVKIL